MPNRLRDNDHIRGLQGPKPKDLEVLKRSNTLTDRAGVLQRLAYQYKIVGGEENPCTSFLWVFPARVKFMQCPRVESCIVDYCACGTPFRARTRLCFWGHKPPGRLAALRCNGRGICQHSGKPHLVLSGTSKQGGFLTRQKNHYPDKLCTIIAKGLSDAAAAILTSRLWSFMT